MMEFKDFKKRLVGTDAELRAIYEQDWKDSEDSTKNYKPFLIYNPEGDFEGRRAQMPSHGLIVGPGSYGAHQTRESRQHQQWRYIATEIACKEPTRPFNVIGRYWDMKTDQTVVDTSLQLRFEASDRVTKAELAAMVKAAVNKCRVSPTIEVVDKGCGGLDGYVWIGSHLLGLYRTYASRDGLQRLRALKQHGPPRPFPTPMQAWQASRLMGMQLPAPGTVPDKKKPKETKTDISEIKIIDYTGKARGKTQGQVMKASATDLAKLFDWPENSQEAGGGWANQAEWLHRSAFSFGGLSNEPVIDNSPQRRENLIFGTKQSNTYMIRPETSVKHLAKLRHASLWDIKENFHPRPNGQQLTATQRQTLGPAEMLWSAKVAVSVSTDFEYGSREDHGGEARALQPLDERLEERVEYAKGTAEATLNTRVPDNQRQHFLKKNDFSFLTHRLIYDVRLEFDENKRHVNERIIIDPFSTFIPLRLEAELDTLVENYVFGDGVLPAEPLKRGVVTESHAVAPQDPVKARVPRRRAKSLLGQYHSHAEDAERYKAPVLNNNVVA
ncbi:hypothetical protein DL93DRAFT_2086128 [Clavulina sp. PMI_390]|nr:hypothetical protein DL93DRAFT_2086128 [Clavulina sp. PMI_390]